MNIQNNPAIAIGVVRVIAIVAILLGLPLTVEQEAALIVVVSLLLSVVSSKLTVPKAPTPDAPAKSIQAG